MAVTTQKYHYAKGRRKNAVATVRLYSGEGPSTINGKPLADALISKLDQRTVLEPLFVLDKVKDYYFTAITKGGGYKGQREAISLALSRALVKENRDYKKELKIKNLLTRDSRMVERKHTGLVKARKAPQYSKR